MHCIFTLCDKFHLAKSDGYCSVWASPHAYKVTEVSFLFTSSSPCPGTVFLLRDILLSRVRSAPASPRLGLVNRGRLVKTDIGRLFCCCCSAGSCVPSGAIHYVQNYQQLWQAGSRFGEQRAGSGVSPTPMESWGAVTRLGEGRLMSHQAHFRALGWSQGFFC